ncbi:hypothetical protein [Candidatus Parabeggiatoa sp. HSG14]|uniref:hypothetical protein n=1 Tax=Candidatus Parabeggiatoa sp. HSG14 TaxID=3055593 RepID=UPI0025A6CEB2|nr:hypothetical protein [Thiotrichales bacterium HSG14]
MTQNVRILSRQEKFYLIQFITMELAQEEKLVQGEKLEFFHDFDAGSQHGFWSQYNAFGAAQKLQTLLEDSQG